jgi:hypothetical protein
MSDFASRQKSDRPSVTLADLTLLVRPPGKSGGIRAFTDAERVDAELYAAEAGTVVEPLPLVEPHQGEHILD